MLSSVPCMYLSTCMSTYMHVSMHVHVHTYTHTQSLKMHTSPTVLEGGPKGILWNPCLFRMALGDSVIPSRPWPIHSLTFRGRIPEATRYKYHCKHRSVNMVALRL